MSKWHPWDKPKISIKINEPMFKLNDNGYMTNLYNDLVREEYERYKQDEKHPRQFPTSKDARLEFEIEMSKKYPEEFKQYISNFGSLDSAKTTFKPKHIKTPLIDYWLERKKEYENTFSPSRSGEWDGNISA